MRDAARIQQKPGEYQDQQRGERQRILEQLLAELARAREKKAEWYEWIRRGRPALSQVEYDQVGKFGKGARRAG